MRAHTPLLSPSSSFNQPTNSSHLERLPLPVEQKLQRHELVHGVGVPRPGLGDRPLVPVPQRLGPLPPLAHRGALRVERRQRVEERRVLDPAVLLPPAAHLARQGVFLTALAAVLPGPFHELPGGLGEQRGLGLRGGGIVDAPGAPAPADAAPGTPRKPPQRLRGVLARHQPVLDQRVRAQQQRRAAQRVPSDVGGPVSGLGGHQRKDLPGADPGRGEKVDKGEGLGAQVADAVRARERSRVEDDPCPASRGRGARDVGVGRVERGACGGHCCESRRGGGRGGRWGGHAPD